MLAIIHKHRNGLNILCVLELFKKNRNENSVLTFFPSDLEVEFLTRGPKSHKNFWLNDSAKRSNRIRLYNKGSLSLSPLSSLSISLVWWSVKSGQFYIALSHACNVSWEM